MRLSPMIQKSILNKFSCKYLLGKFEFWKLEFENYLKFAILVYSRSDPKTWTL